MQKFFLFLIILSQILFFSSCTHIATQEEVDAEEARLRWEIKRLEGEKEKLKNENDEKQKQIAYLKNKICVLKNEEADGRNNIKKAREQIKDTFNAQMKIISESEDQLFDCLFGNAPIPRTQTLSPAKPTLLIDQKNEVNVDSVLFCGGELYCDSKVELRFCVLRPAKAAKNTFIVDSVSDLYIYQERGGYRAVFPRDKRLLAKKGYLVGLYIKKYSSITYDDFGTGVTLEVPVKKLLPNETAIDLPPILDISSASDQPRGKAFSFRLFGSTYLD